MHGSAVGGASDLLAGNRPILLKNSYRSVWRITFGGLRWSPESVAFNSGRSTRSHLGTVDPETLHIEFFNRIGHQLTLADADWASASDCLPPVTFAQ